MNGGGSTKNYFTNAARPKESVCVAAIDDRAFYKNRKIRRALIGTNIQSIGKMAFYGTKQLRYIDIRTKKLKAIGKKAFIGIYPAAKIKIPRTRKKKYIKLLAKKYG